MQASKSSPASHYLFICYLLPRYFFNHDIGDSSSTGSYIYFTMTYDIFVVPGQHQVRPIFTAKSLWGLRAARLIFVHCFVTWLFARKLMDILYSCIWQNKWHFYFLVWSQPLGPNFPSPWATILALRLDCSTAALTTPQKVLPIWNKIKICTLIGHILGQDCFPVQPLYLKTKYGFTQSKLCFFGIEKYYHISNFKEAAPPIHFESFWYTDNGTFTRTLESNWQVKKHA